MSRLSWWMRVVGAFYVLQFVAMAIVRAPIRAQGPAGTLDRAAAGDPLANFLVDTWVTFGLEVAAIGVVLMISAGKPEQARALVWAVLGIEVARGLIADVYMIVRGHPVPVLVTWLVIHTVILVTGVIVLRRSSAPLGALQRPS